MTPDPMMRTYADLAELYDRQGQPKHRDWFLVLAADAALSAGQPAEADRLLGRLLSVNPHHLLRPFGSFAEALRSPDVDGYVGSLRRSYPPDRAEQLLEAERTRAAAPEPAPPPPPPPPPPAPPRRPPPRSPAPAPVGTPAAQEAPRVLYARLRTDAEEEPAPPAPPPRAAPPPPPPRPAAPPRPAPPPEP